MKSLQTVCLLFATAGFIAAQQYTISTVAGIPQVPGDHPLPSDATPTLATAGQLYHPSVVSVDSKGNFYIADSYTYAVRLVNITTGNISTIGGNGNPGTSGEDVSAITANLLDINGIAFDSSGNVYISDTSSCRIRRIDNPFTNTTPNIATFVGNIAVPFCGATSNAPFVTPGALVFDSKGNLYVADYSASVVKMVTSSGVVSTFAGTGTFGFSGDGGPASKASLAYPVSLTFDSAGNLYIGDEGNNNIRKVDTSGNISTVATGVTPKGLGIDAAGNFYFVDGVSSSVKKILPGGGVASIAGNGQASYGGDGSFNGTVWSGGQASLAALNQPSAVAVAPDGSILVADTMNDVIRRLVAVPSSIGVQDAASEQPGSALQPGSISPGEVLVLSGSGLGPSTLTQFTVTNGQFPTQIAGTSVTFNGIPAPLIYTSAGLAAVIAPYGISTSTSANIALTYQGKTYSASMPVSAVSPAVFTSNASGSGQIAAVNPDGTINSASNPAHLGSFVAIYITGAGSTTSPIDGQVASSTCGVSCLPVPLSSIQVKIGTKFLTVGNGITYAGNAPSLVAGMTQINFQIPATLIPGSVPVQVIVNNIPSQPGTYISVTQ